MLRLPGPDRFLLVTDEDEMAALVARSVAPKERWDWMAFLCTKENPSADPSRAASARSTAKHDSRDGAMVNAVEQVCVYVADDWMD